MFSKGGRMSWNVCSVVLLLLTHSHFCPFLPQKVSREEPISADTGSVSAVEISAACSAYFCCCLWLSKQYLRTWKLEIIQLRGSCKSKQLFWGQILNMHVFLCCCLIWALVSFLSGLKLFTSHSISQHQSSCVCEHSLSRNNWTHLGCCSLIPACEVSLNVCVTCDSAVDSGCFCIFVFFIIYLFKMDNAHKSTWQLM